MRKLFCRFFMILMFFYFHGFVSAEIPTLILPESGAVLDNGCSDFSDKIEWDFDWSDVIGATQYHLYVIGPTATYPVINNSSLSTSDYHHEKFSYIMNTHLYNWKWKVRAYVDENWTDWSEERSFDVEPLDADCGAVPTLISPTSGAVLDNGCSDFSDKIEWDFDWSDVIGATQYHLYVIGGNTTIPLIDNSSLSTSAFHHENSGYIINDNLYNWKWKVRAYVDGNWTYWSEERSFDVEPLDTDCNVIPGIPTLISPASGAVMDNGCSGSNNKIEWKFDWSDVNGATQYHLYVIGPTATIPIINNSSLSTSCFQYKSSEYIINDNLYNWKWKVRAYVNGIWNDWSEERSFDVEPLDIDCGVIPGIPILISPERGAVMDNACYFSDKIEWDFDWSDVNGATRYHLYVIGGHATSPLINKYIFSTSNYHYESSGYIIKKNLHNWKWKVRAYVNGNWNDWSEERKFDVEPLGTDCDNIPILISPESGAVLDNGCYGINDKIEWDFDWSDVNGATKYHLYVINEKATIPLINKYIFSTSNYHHESSGYIIKKNLHNWKWKVRAYVNGNWNNWSEERKFDVEPLNTDCTSVIIKLSKSYLK